MHSRNLVGEKKNPSVTRVLSTENWAYEEFLQQALDESHVPSSIERKQSSLEFAFKKFRMSYRLIIVRCRSTKLQSYLVIYIFFYYTLSEILATRFMFVSGSTNGLKSRSCWSGDNGSAVFTWKRAPSQPWWKLLADFSVTEIRRIISQF